MDIINKGSGTLKEALERAAQKIERTPTSGGWEKEQYSFRAQDLRRLAKNAAAERTATWSLGEAWIVTINGRDWYYSIVDSDRFLEWVGFLL